MWSGATTSPKRGSTRSKVTVTSPSTSKRPLKKACMYCSELDRTSALKETWSVVLRFNYTYKAKFAYFDFQFNNVQLYVQNVNT